MRTRGWCFTLNNYTEAELASTDDLINKDEGIRYLSYGKEVGESGTPHLQGYIYFEHQTALPKCKRLLPRAHLEPQRGTISQAINYCHKDKDFYEFGTRPETPEEKGKRGREGIEQRWKLAKEGRFEELPPEHFKIYKAIYLEYKPKPKKLEGELLNEWIWGPAGYGKSTLAEKENPIFYEKMLNRWWDNYKDEEVVRIEEVSPDHKEWIGAFMKIWADRSPFNAEIKGAVTMIRPKKIVVTSNYPPEECFKVGDLPAIQRRFKVRYYDYRLNKPEGSEDKSPIFE